LRVCYDQPGQSKKPEREAGKVNPHRSLVTQAGAVTVGNHFMPTLSAPLPGDAGRDH